AGRRWHGHDPASGEPTLGCSGSRRAPGALTTVSARPLVAVLLLPCLAGCLVGPDYRRPAAATPPSWGELAPTGEPGRSEAIATGTPTGWWLAFDDPLLTSIIERTVAANLTLQQAEARVREARASRRIAAAPLWPQIGSSGSYTRARTSKNGLGAVTPGKSTHPLPPPLPPPPQPPPPPPPPPP